MTPDEEAECRKIAAKFARHTAPAIDQAELANHTAQSTANLIGMAAGMKLSPYVARVSKRERSEAEARAEIEAMVPRKFGALE